MNIKAIMTTEGPKQIDYNGLAELPVSDETLSVIGAFADAYATGKAIENITPVIHNKNSSAYNIITCAGNAVVTRIQGKSIQDAFPSLESPQDIKCVGMNGGVTIKCATTEVNYPVELHGVGDIKDEVILLMPGDNYVSKSGDTIIVNEPSMILWKRIGKITYSGTENWLVAGENSFYIDLSSAKRDFGPTSKNIISSSFRTTDNMSYDEIADATCVLYNDLSLYPDKNWLYVRSDTYNTLELFKDYLAEKPMTLIYPLATPYAELLPFKTELLTPSGACTIFTTDQLSPIIDVDVAKNRDGAYILNNFINTIQKGVD